MFRKSSKGYYFWDEFEDVAGLVHGFSTRKFKNMNWKKTDSKNNLRLFCKKLGIDVDNTVTMVQVHSNRVFLPSLKDRGKKINDVDGLVTNEKGIFAVATFADCVPVMFVDKKRGIAGICHAGWKGVYKEIATKMINKMTKLGSKKSNIIVGIGPSIGKCCYDIDKSRAEKFLNKFPNFKKIIIRKSEKLYLDLGSCIEQQVENAGIPKKNTINSNFCTKDNFDNFYSFRKEGGTKTFGLCAGLIGYK